VKNFQVSYDYRCPFAKNIHLHLVTALQAGADFQVNFIPWTLSQGYREDGAPDVWNDLARDSELLALAVSTSIRDQQPDLFLAAHEALFKARHERAIRLVTIEEIDEVLGPVGVDMQRVRDDVATRRPHQVIGESFAQYERYEAFGVPTFVVNGDATFVRYMTAPGDNAYDSIKMLDALVTMMELEPALNEFKHTRVSM
jgi:protein-disulfide isomerase-like protein with CxxC motif